MYGHGECSVQQTFHEHSECVSQHSERGEEDQYGEDEGADGVGKVPVGLSSQRGREGQG